MRECPGIQEYVIDLVGPGLLDAIDDLVFGIALERGQVVAVLRREGIECGLHVGEARGSIDAGFAGAEQIEIGTVYQEQARHSADSCQFAGDGGNSNPFRGRWRKFRLK